MAGFWRAGAVVVASFAMLALLLALGLVAEGTPEDPEPLRSRARIDYVQAAKERQAEMIRRLVRRGDPAAVEYVSRQLKRGLPPLALQAFLQEARLHPQPDYVEPLRRLARYRTLHVRAQALVALAAHGDAEAMRATLAALDDPALPIRLLGLDLVQEYTNPAVEEAALALIARDPEVRRTVQARRRAVQTAPSS